MLSAVSLANFLAFRELRLEMRPLTLLSGTNSAGKSSLLHALALLRQSHLTGTLPDSLLLNGELVELGTGRDVLHDDPVELEGDRVAIRLGVETAHGRLAWTANYEPAADVLPCEQERHGNGDFDTSGGLFAVGFQYLKADRIVPAVTYPKSHEAVTVQHSLGAAGEHTPNYLRVHGEEPVRCKVAALRGAVSQRLIDQTNAWLDILSSGTLLSVKDVEGTDLVRLVYQRQGPDVRTKGQRATNVGFGLTYALPVVVACLMASPGSLILIENPEAHLHPQGQARLGRLCALAASAGAQVIVETHSDHVLNAVRLAVKREELPADSVILQFFSRKDEDLQPTVETLEVGPDGMLAAWPEGFFDEWDRALDQLLS